jgi:hypothetical protein
MPFWCARGDSAIRSTAMLAPRSLSENRKPTAEKLFWPFPPLIFVKYSQYSPQISEKNGLIWLSLATTTILGQAPSSTRRGYSSMVKGKTLLNLRDYVKRSTQFP